MKLNLVPVNIAYGNKDTSKKYDSSDNVQVNTTTPIQTNVRTSVSRFIKFVPKAISNSIMGVAYDIKSWKYLPHDVRKNGTLRTLRFILTRDNREIYLFLFILMILFVVFFIASIVSGRRRKRYMQSYVSQFMPYHMFRNVC